MKIISFQTYRYVLPFVNPISVRGVKLSQREGLIIHCTSEQGIEGFGEAAPLPGLSEESLEDVIEEVEMFESVLLDQDVPKNIEKFEGALTEWLSAYSLSPSLQFAIETAMLNLMANSRKILLSQLFEESPVENISVNGLLQGTMDEVVLQAKACLLNGFTAMKLKVGRKDMDEDIRNVQAVSEIIRDKALLHLDANQAWTLKEAVKFGQAIGCACVDYIEEPLQDVAGIPEFFHQTLIPAALDESLQNLDIKDVGSIEGADVVVVKPTILGGIEKTYHLIKYARERALRCVVSSSFESSIGVTTLAHLAASLTPRTAAGLDTLKFFQKDVLKKGVFIQKGKIPLSQCRVRKENVQINV